MYFYTASGQKVQKVVTENTTVTTTDYLGGYQYQNTVLQFFPTAEGYVKNTPVSGTNTYSYVFNYTDHLGNTRLSYTKDTTTGSLKILEENNYYPFGLKHNSYNVDNFQPGYKYKYNGKELQDENIGGNQLNMYDYGARNYDPALGRWMNVDPLAETSMQFSPYTYALDNPVFFIDPDGMESVGADGLTNSQWMKATRPGGDSDLTQQYQAQNRQNEQALEYAKLSKHVYGEGGDTGGYTQVGDSYNYDSGLKAALYKKGSMYVLAIAGTDFSQWKDWKNNAEQLLGAAKQYKEGLDLAKTLLRRSEINGHLTVTGHSLGGGIAEYIAMNKGIHAVTFNSAGVSIFTSGIDRNSNTDAYILRTDPLNVIQQNTILPSAGGRIHYLTPDFNPGSYYNGHSIDHIIEALTPNHYFQDISRALYRAAKRLKL